MFRSSFFNKFVAVLEVLVFTVFLSVFIMPLELKNVYADGYGSWTSPYSVSQAISDQSNSVKTVIGYVTGQPISSVSYRTSGYTDNYSIAIADGSLETNVQKMIFVQIASSFRNSFGLMTNPDLKGTYVKVTGNLTPYFSPHAGIKNITRIEKVQATSPTSTRTPSPTSKPAASSTNNNYYKDAIGKSGSELKQALHDIIDNHTEISYKNLWSAIKETDEDPDNSNNVVLLYTGRSQGKNTNGSGANNWNREHVWAKSHGDFGTSMGPGTDLHHIRATDASVNSTRSNKDFDYGGTYHSEATECKYDNDSWEARDSVKGDVARMLFYMDVRYEGDNGEIDLGLNNIVNNGTSPYHGKLSTLIKWHKQDPVDSIEIRRNNIIYDKWQHNRNPFIDHPEWVELIWQ